MLGFGHEQSRPDGAGAACYSLDFPDIIKIGPPDPASIMGWSYCSTALGHLSLEDIRGVRAIYGPRPLSDPRPAVIGELALFVLD